MPDERMYLEQPTKHLHDKRVDELVAEFLLDLNLRAHTAVRGFANHYAQLEEERDRRYYDGARHALHRFAWWRDGVEYVGSTGYTLEKAMADVDAAEAEGRSYSL